MKKAGENRQDASGVTGIERDPAKIARVPVGVALDEMLDNALADSFPASDPVAVMRRAEDSGQSPRTTEANPDQP